MYCSKCGNQMNDDDMFCPNCGSAVNDNAVYDNMPVQNNCFQGYTAPNPQTYSQYQPQYPPQYSQPYQPQPYIVNNYQVPAYEKKSNGWCIASFIMALIGIIYGALFCGATSLILGVVGMVTFDENKHTNRWMGIVGISVGVIDILIGIFIVSFVYSLYSYLFSL